MGDCPRAHRRFSRDTRIEPAAHVCVRRNPRAGARSTACRGRSHRCCGMTEPLTAATDVVVAAAGATFAVRIVRATTDRAARLVAGSLAAASFGALAGAAYHMARSSVMWKVSAIPVGVASYLFGLAIALAYFSARGRRVAQVVLLVRLLVYAICVALSDDFGIVIADYASVLVAILLVCLFHWSDAA